MIKTVIFDIDNTLYDYDSAHLSGMKALTAYCIKEFKISEKQVLSCYDKAMKIMSERIGTDSAAIHSRMLRFQCMTELLSQPLFPHVENMYHAYWDTMIANAEIIEGDKETSSKTVGLGSTVTIKDLSSEEEETYTIVGSIEADPLNGKLSNITPLAVALLDNKLGDIVEVSNVEEPYKVKIVNLK